MPEKKIDKLEIWNQLNQPPKWALKTIGGGRLKGFTDINPQFRYYAMTKLFGPCGIGWKFSIDEMWERDGSNGEKMIFVKVSVCVRRGEFSEVPLDKDEGNWSAPIPGIGGSKLLAKESAGIHNNDEAYKMALTDAISGAVKMLGVAADIYAGLWDGAKYREVPENADSGKKPVQAASQPAKPAQQPQQPAQPAQGASQPAQPAQQPTQGALPVDDNPIPPECRGSLHDPVPTTKGVNQQLEDGNIDMTKFEHIRGSLKKKKIPPKQWKIWLKANFGIESAQYIKNNQYQSIIDVIVETPDGITNWQEGQQREPGEN